MKNLLILLFFSVLFLSTQAQKESLALIPDDINIKTGTFSNGLKYYIKGNSIPNDKLELRLVVKVGSVVEDDDQQGLAHFMEHMCFNGTKNFEKNELVSYLQSIGVKFGAHVNAYTSFDKTVYRLSIPSNNKSEVEKGFQIIEDWAFNVVLTDEEINKERGVVIEEYRTRLGAENRMKKNYYPKMYYNSQYAERLPIGKKDILENFEPEVLRRFYKDWYRPDLMAVIVVGDISVEELEKKVKKHFDKPNKREKPRERKYYSDESHENTLISIESDKEVVSNSVSIWYKNPEVQLTDNSEQALQKSLKESIFSIMINNRFNEIANSNSPPFMYGKAMNANSYIKNKKTYKLSAGVKNDDYLLALKTLVIENERIKKFGFTLTEFERAKESLLKSVNKISANKNKQSSKQFVTKMLNNFLDEKAMPSLGWSIHFYNNEIPKIQLEDIKPLINEYLRKDNRFVLVKGKEKLITEKEITDMFLEVENDSNIKPYIDKVVKKELFTEKLEAGSITNKTETDHDIKTVTLNNGVKVHYKITRFRNDKILFKAMSKGGTSLLSTEDFFETHYALNNLKHAGIGGFTKTELKKILAGKSVSVNPYIYSKTEGMKGSSSPEDLETLFQLIYLNFTQLNKDQTAFDAYIERAKSSVDNYLESPDYFFTNEFNKFQYAKHLRHVPYPTKEDYEKTNYNLAYKIYQERFANAADFDFSFVGNFDEQKLLAFAKKYLANLPATAEREEYIETKMNALSGDYTKTIYKGTEEKSKAQIVYRGDYKYNEEESLAFSTLKEILKIKLLEKLREEVSGVYSPSVSSRFDQLNNSYSLKIRFSCAPENVNSLIELTKKEIKKFIAEGPSKTDLNKVKEYYLLGRKATLSNNNFWLRNVSQLPFYKFDIGEIKTYEKRVKALSTQDIQNIAKKFLDKGAVVGILLPEKD